jgi:hypothetical protein
VHFEELRDQAGLIRASQREAVRRCWMGTGTTVRFGGGQVNMRLRECNKDSTGSYWVGAKLLESAGAGQASISHCGWCTRVGVGWSKA